MRIPGYSIERLIGKGGMASVYLAVQKSLNRRVALKVMNKFDDPRQAERFLHEGRVIAALNHRNIITIYDVGTVGDRHFIAMEYLQGRSLTERIEEGMPLAKSLSLLEQMAACLHHVHRRGIIHRDIKPSNILFHADGTPKLTDFGIAKLIDSDQELTLDGSAIGSPYYLSPEQAEGDPLDGRSDIYALGIVFYEMLTGKRPYAKNTPLETVVAHLTQPLPALPRQYASYQRLLERMIAKDPADRFGSAKELAYQVREMKELAAGGPARTASVNAVPGQRPERAQNPGWRSAVAWGLLALVASSGLYLLTGTQSPDAQPESLAATQLAESGPGPEKPAKAAVSTPVVASPPEAGPAVNASAVSTVSRGESDRPSDPRTTAREADPVEAPRGAGLAAGSATSQTEELSESPSPAAGISDTVKSEAKDSVIASDSPVDGEPTDDELAAEEPVDTQARQIEEWMQSAQQALRRARLTRPQRDNAYSYYRQVLKIDPTHAGARAGLHTIADRYAGMAQRALQRDQDAHARRYVVRGLGIRPQHSRLVALRTELDERERRRLQPERPVVDVQALPGAGETAQQDSIRGEGSGNIVRDFKRVWRAVFD